MKVQRVKTPDSNQTTWLVINSNYLPIEPVTEFLTYLRNLERSPNTIRSYAYHLKLYWQYLEESRTDWKDITIPELADFITWLRSPTGKIISLQQQEAKRTESTVNVILSSVCMLYDFHEKTGKVPEIPLYRSRFMPGKRYKTFLHHITKSKPIRTRLLKLKQPKLQPKTLTTEHVQNLISACNNARDKFLLCLLYESGIRIGQALGLRHEDIKSWDNTITITPRNDNENGARAKSTSPYTVNVTQDLMALYTQYLQEELMEIITDDTSDYVFVNLWDGKIGSPLTYSNVMSLFTRLKRKTGIAISVTPHKLRHTHATELIREGVPMSHVQTRLGHSSIQTTIDTYVHVSNEDMRLEYDKYLEKRNESTSIDTSAKS